MKEFQRDHQLTQDGVCGPKTWDALQKAFNAISTPSEPQAEFYSITIPHLSKTQAEALQKAYPDSKMNKE